MAKRLGSNFPAEGVEYWTKFMGKTAASTMIGFGESVPYVDITGDLPNIKCPTLVMTTEASALGSVESTREWQVMTTYNTAGAGKSIADRGERAVHPGGARQELSREKPDAQGPARRGALHLDDGLAVEHRSSLLQPYLPARALLAGAQFGPSVLLGQ